MTKSGKYTIHSSGEPSSTVQDPPPCGSLSIPLFSQTLSFSQVLVKKGDTVSAGQTLAVDPAKAELPLVAPASGSVEEATRTRHLIVRVNGQDAPPAVATGGDSPERIARSGVWPYFRRTDTGEVPRGDAKPDVLIVTTSRLEPFHPRAEAVFANGTDVFGAGLGRLTRIFPSARILVAVPDVKDGTSAGVRDLVKSVKGVEAAAHANRYPDDLPLLVCRRAGIAAAAGVWSVSAEGVIAIEVTLASGRPSAARLVCVAGPGVSKPGHFRVPVGYPVQMLLDACGVVPGEVRVVAGGMLSGRAVPKDQLGVDVECSSLTVIPEQSERMFLSFSRTGFSEHCFCRAFAGVVRPRFAEKYTTALRGERRPCVNCGFCEDVCPVGIMPALLHRYIRKDALEMAQRTGTEQCVECGLCALVCVSKVELLDIMRDGKRRIRKELRAEGVEA